MDPRLTTERNIWLATTRTDGRPHLTPIWFVWLHDKIYVCTQGKAVKTRNLAANPNVAFSLENARSVIDAVALALLFVALAGILIRSLDTAIWLLAGQGVLLGLAAAAAALVEGTTQAWIVFIVALAVKAVAIPRLLFLVLDRLTRRHEVEFALRAVVAFPLAVCLVLLAYAVSGPFTDGFHATFATPNALPAALALLLLGCYSMVIKKKALSQVIGLVTMENGLYLAAIAATRGLPLTVEFGVALDVLTGVAIMGLVIHEIDRQFGSTGIDRLRSLRG